MSFPPFNSSSLSTSTSDEVKSQSNANECEMKDNKDENNGNNDMIVMLKQFLIHQTNTMTNMSNLITRLSSASISSSSSNQPTASSNLSESSSINSTDSSSASASDDDNKIYKIPTDLLPASSYNTTTEYLNYIIKQCRIKQLPERLYCEVVYVNSPATSPLGVFIEHHILEDVTDDKDTQDKKLKFKQNWSQVYKYIIEKFAPSDLHIDYKAKVLKFMWNYDISFQLNKINYENIITKAKMSLNDSMIIYIFISVIPMLIKKQIIGSNLLNGVDLLDINDFNVLFNVCIQSEKQLKLLYGDEYQMKLQDGSPAGSMMNGSSIESTLFTQHHNSTGNGKKKDGNKYFGGNQDVTSIMGSSTSDKVKVTLEITKKSYKPICPYFIVNACKNKSACPFSVKYY